VPLILGPVLRHVSETTAVVWVQTEEAADVEVLGCSARTFEVSGFHYALVVVRGLTPDTVTEYQVLVDGEQVWPEAESKFPPSVIRTRGPETTDRLRVVFGSCRYPKTGDDKLDAKLGADALDCYATRLTGLPVDEWPDALLLLGDQVYADELTPDARRNLAGHRRRLHGRPADEVVTFTEYERLYQHTWGDPEIRWVLSTVPTAMIFDDHDIRDDWNTSATWRAEVNAKPWWRDRIRAGLATYWVYQHLGNLSPEELAVDEDFRKVLAIDGDCWGYLEQLADRADTEVEGEKAIRFSFRWDLGRNRLVMVDSRNSRVLDSGDRKMLDDSEFAWVQAQMNDGRESLDHLLIGTSLPWLMPPVIADVQSVNEQTTDRGGIRGRLGEKLRQAADLEHWPAFTDSFLRLSAALAESAGAEPAPATVSVLSGDVHHSYAARADFTDTAGAPVHQLVCSPVHNYVPGFLKPVFKTGWSPKVSRVTRRWARRHGSPELPMSWQNLSGPLFGNTIATLRAAGRRAEVVFEQPDDNCQLDVVAEVALTAERPPPRPVRS